VSQIRRIYDPYYPYYFVTVKTFENRKIFGDYNKCRLLYRVFNHLKSEGYINLFAWVILPDHFHLLLEITGMKNISEVIHDLKSYSANQISKLILSSRGAVASAPRAGNNQKIVGEASAPRLT